MKGQQTHYAGGHFKIMVAMKKRLRIMRDWSKRRGLDFSITIGDLRPWLVKNNNEFLSNIHLERTDKTKGFVPGNLKVKNLKALARHVAEMATKDQEEHK